MGNDRALEQSRDHLPGRKPNAERYASEIKEAEQKLADRLPEVAENALEMALARKPEKCPAHHAILECPDRDCGYQSVGYPTSERMVTYVLDRIMGKARQQGEQQINLEFVKQLSRHVTDVFMSVNELEDPDERAREFASGIAQMWALVGERNA